MTPGSPMPFADALERRVPPVALLLLSAAAMAGVAAAWPAGPAIPARPAVAAALAAVGVAVALAGVVSFRRHRTTVNPLSPQNATALVSTGIYRASRNPMYLGMALALLGWGVLLGSAAALLGVPAFMAWLDRFQIRPEERALQARFGAEFEAYRRAVRRWL